MSEHLACHNLLTIFTFYEQLLVLDTVTSLLVILPCFRTFFACGFANLCFVTMGFLPLVCISFTIPHLYLIRWDLPLSSSKLWVESSCKSISGYHLSNGLLSPLSYPPPQGLSVLDMATGSSRCLHLIQQHPKTSLQGLTCISTPSSFRPLSLSRFLFLFLFHLWPLNLLRFRAFFHQQLTSPMTHCLYLMQQLLRHPTISGILLRTSQVFSSNRVYQT